MKKNELWLVGGENPLLLELRVKHGVLEFGDEKLEQIITYNDLNHALGRLVSEGRIDLLEDASPFMEKVGRTLLPADVHVATLVDGHVLPDEINMLGLKFKYCHDCTQRLEHRVGHFHTPLGPIGPPVVASFGDALSYIVGCCADGDLPAQVGVALLQQVRRANLPLETPVCLMPRKQGTGDPISHLKKMFEVLLRDGPPQTDEEF